MVTSVQLGHVVGDLGPVDRDDRGINDTETFIGTVGGEFGRRRAYIKVLRSHQLANELLCATIGREIGLSIPTPYLLEVLPEDLPDSHLLREPGALLYAFGSDDASHPSLRRRMERRTSLDYSLISGWRGWENGATFDQWVANGDRHGGNILMESREVMWLIDHDYAFTGPRWIASRLIPSAPIHNQILLCFNAALQADARSAALDRIRECMTGLRAVDIGGAMTASRVNTFLAPSDSAALEQFIQERLKSVVHQMADVLGMPMLAGVNP